MYIINITQIIVQTVEVGKGISGTGWNQGKDDQGKN